MKWGVRETTNTHKLGHQPPSGGKKLTGFVIHTIADSYKRKKLPLPSRRREGPSHNPLSDVGSSIPERPEVVWVF